MKWITVLLLVTMCGTTLTGCGEQAGTPAEPDDKEPISYEFTFATGRQGWTGDYADYPPEMEDTIEFQFRRSPLPDYLDGITYGLFVSGRNASDDLFMFIKREFTNLDPMTTYHIDFSITIASDATEGSIGIGGGPGSSVYLKAGATIQEPSPITRLDGSIGMNIDKGNQASGGMHSMVLGNIGIAENTDEEPYVLKSLASAEPFTATTGSDGVLWVCIGTDSGFEGTTALYYTSIALMFTAQ